MHTIYKVVQCYLRTWISCKCILQTLGWPWKNIMWFTKKGKKWNHIKCTIETKKGEKSKR